MTTIQLIIKGEEEEDEEDDKPDDYDSINYYSKVHFSTQFSERK